MKLSIWTHWRNLIKKSKSKDNHFPLWETKNKAFKILWTRHSLIMSPYQHKEMDLRSSIIKRCKRAPKFQTSRSLILIKEKMHGSTRILDKNKLPSVTIEASRSNQQIILIISSHPQCKEKICLYTMKKNLKWVKWIRKLNVIVRRIIVLKVIVTV